MIKKTDCLLGFFFLLTMISDAFAMECGALRLEKSRSLGVDISGNTCANQEKIAVNSTLQLKPAARAWLESVDDNGKASKFKIICQNESSSPTKIKIASAVLPWIQPESSLNCGTWIDKRLECKQPGNDKLGLVCVIALRNKVAMTHEILANASVNMRGITGQSKLPTLSKRKLQQLKLIMENKVNKKLKWCQNLVGGELTINWSIDTSGKATNFAASQKNSPQVTTNNPFANCIIYHIKAHQFPVFSNDIMMSSTFN